MDYPLADSGLWGELSRRADLKNRESERLRAAKYLSAIDRLQQVCEDVLPLVETMFPHYLPHGVKHSRAIISRLGQLIPPKTVKSLSCAELYALMAAAFCHDLGMIVTQQDAEAAECSPAFAKFRDDKAQEFAEIERLRGDGRRLAADLAYRYVLAEWFRHRHAQRSGQFALAHAGELADLGCGDSSLRGAIVATASGHWLTDPRDLEDESRFPTDLQARDGGEEVNVRFLALCLRIGDLLDMDSPRACPLLRRLVEELPEGSAAHWDRHEALRLTVKPDKVRIEKTCKSQEEHRLLHEWCEWLHDEVDRAAALLADQPENRRLRITPAKVDCTIRSDGSYVFTRYRFGLDDEQVFQKLFGENLYGSKSPFIRELLQNALDATRCRVIEDLRDARTPWDESKPTWQLPPEVTQRYPITFRLDLREYQGEPRLVISCHDCGIGMDRHIIENHFLKVGRTYYDSHEFRSRYQFRPIGQFGIGFMSCFMAADYVEVETCRDPLPGDPPDDPIRLSIPGWRNYFLTSPARERRPKVDRPASFEPKSYRGHGTSVYCYLEPDVYFDLRSALREAVGYVEFPIILDYDDDAHTAMAARRPDDRERPRFLPREEETPPPPPGTDVALPWPPESDLPSVDLSGPEMAPSRLHLSLEEAMTGIGLTQDGVNVRQLHPGLLGHELFYPGSPWHVSLDLWGRDSLRLTTDRTSPVAGQDFTAIAEKALPRLTEGGREVVMALAEGKARDLHGRVAAHLWRCLDAWHPLLLDRAFGEALLSISLVRVRHTPRGGSSEPLGRLAQGTYLAFEDLDGADDERSVTDLDGAPALELGRDDVPLWAVAHVHSICVLEGGGYPNALTLRISSAPGILQFGPALSRYTAVYCPGGWYALNPENGLAQEVVRALGALPGQWEAHPWARGLSRCPEHGLWRLDHNGATFVRSHPFWDGFIALLSERAGLDAEVARALMHGGAVALYW